MNQLPPHIEYNGNKYCLTCEIMTAKQTQVLLTYEQEPLDEESFLIGSIGCSLDAAIAKMCELLKAEKLI